MSTANRLKTYNNNNIHILNDDCLIYIFSLLPIIDRVNVQKVCKRWALVSKLSWKTVKKFKIDRPFWGLTESCRTRIDHKYFRGVLNKCGRFVTHIDFSKEDGLYEQIDHKLRIPRSKNILSIVHENCPNLRSLNVGRPLSRPALESIANFFYDLTHFSVELPDKSYEEILSKIFLSNKNIKSLSLTRSKLTGQCLLDLNFETLEELYIIDSAVESIPSLAIAIEQSTKMHTLTLERIHSEENEWMNTILKVLCTLSKNLRNLKLYFYEYFFEPIVYDYLAELKNVEKLDAVGKRMVNDDVLRVISDNYKKLTTLKLYFSNRITVQGILSLSFLPSLEILNVSSVGAMTDEVLNYLPKLKKLECCRCPNLKNDGVSKLLQTSSKIEYIKLTFCENVNPSALDNFIVNSKSKKLKVEIDSSEIGYDYFKNIYIVTKYNDRITRKIKKLCYECFKTKQTISSCDLCCDILQIEPNS